jgi:hypothetical protein
MECDHGEGGAASPSNNTMIVVEIDQNGSANREGFVKLTVTGKKATLFSRKISDFQFFLLKRCSARPSCYTVQAAVR